MIERHEEIKTNTTPEQENPFVPSPFIFALAPVSVLV